MQRVRELRDAPGFAGPAVSVLFDVNWKEKSELLCDICLDQEKLC